MTRRIRVRLYHRYPDAYWGYYKGDNDWFWLKVRQHNWTGDRFVGTREKLLKRVIAQVQNRYHKVEPTPPKVREEVVIEVETDR